MFSTVFGVACLLATTMAACPDDWVSNSGFCYWKSPNTLQWADAELLCGAKDAAAHLASVHSLEENTFLKSQLGAGFTWIGLNDVDEEGQFIWTDGTATDFLYWKDGEPNNDGNQDCAGIATTAGGEWDDYHCEERTSFICKMPETA